MRWSLALAFLAAACAPHAEPDAADPTIPFAQELQDAAVDALDSGRGNHDLGLSVSIFVPGFEIWSGVAGTSHSSVPITTTTLFDAGSVAKNLEAALAITLDDEGVLDLDEPISDWLPSLPHVDGAITIRQLLNHTSGVFNVFENPAFPWLGTEVDYTREWGLEEMFSTLVLDPYGPPGTVQHYSSTNYKLLTVILEEATGRSVPEAVRDRFLGPLGLDHTMMTMGDGLPEGFPVAHPMVDIDEDGTLDDLSGSSRRWIASLTHPVLFTTPTDLVRWIAALYHDRTVLNGSSLEAMLTYPHPEELDPEGARYGLGVVDFSEILGADVFGHAGSALGYSAAALYLPEYGVAMAWAINTGESPSELADALMGRVWRSLSSVVFQHLAPGTR